MKLPPWAIEAIRNGVVDVAKKASDPNTIQKVRQQAAELLRDLPEQASRSLDAMVKTASETAKAAVDQGRESVSKWSGTDSHVFSPCLNATSTLLSCRGPLGNHQVGLGVDEDVVQAGLEILRGNCDLTSARDHFRNALSNSVGNSETRVLVAHSFDAAIAALPSVASNRPMVMHRSHAIRLPSGVPIPELLGETTIEYHGGAEAYSRQDFPSQHPMCVLLADDGRHPIEPREWAGTQAITIGVIPVATIHQPIDGIPTATELLSGGMDLVVVAGNAVNGCPPCGILLGKPHLIEQIESSHRWRALSASETELAMVFAAVRATTNPFQRLVETNIENLRSRAERMATRLTGCGSIAQCQVTDEDAFVIADHRWSFPSRQLRLKHDSMSAGDWQAALNKGSPSVFAATDDNGSVVVDLRWIPASADGSLSSQIENAAGDS